MVPQVSDATACGSQSSFAHCQCRRGRLGDVCSADVVESGSDLLARRWGVVDGWLSAAAVADNDDDELHDARDDPDIPTHADHVSVKT